MSIVLATQKPIRAKILLGLVILCFAGLVARLVDLSVLDGGFLRSQGNMRSLRIVDVPASRGAILDRHGTLLASSIIANNVWVNANKLDISAVPLTRLSQILDIPQHDLASKLKQKRDFVYLARQISSNVANQIKALQIPGINFEKAYRRYYPYGNITAHLLGFDNVDDVGQEGLELAFNRWLTGASGKLLVEKDRMGHTIAIKEQKRIANPGHTLTLSIDHRLQSLAFRALQEGVQNANAESGSLVIMSPKTGEVLALANYPSYDPNVRHTQITADFRNRAIIDLFEPGSTVKPFTMVSVLSSGQYNLNSKIDTSNGLWYLNGHPIVDEASHARWLTPRDILQRSSNVGIAKLATHLPAKRLGSYYNAFGLGRSTQSGFPGEPRGMVNDEYLHNKFALATLSFGYGIMVTNLQLAHAYTVLASDGVDHGVTFIKRSGKVPARQVVDKLATQRVVNLLESVVSPHGTGHAAIVPGVRVAGKTGTSHIASAQGGYQHDAYVASFVGLLPVESPKWVVSVVLYRPDYIHRFGGLAAAPVFARVGNELKQWYLI